jgi:hypothetical protein
MASSHFCLCLYTGYGFLLFQRKGKDRSGPPETLHASVQALELERVAKAYFGQSCALLANACFLERPQRAQRRLLCLGETSDARDSEALVEPIPPQCLQLLATVEVQSRMAPSSPQLASLLPSGLILSECTVP